MKHLAIALLTALIVAAVEAAPVPKESPAEKLKRIYGTTVDPDKNCRFTLEGDALRIRVSGDPHRLVPQTGPSNAPRTLRSVEGDFTASVRIRQPRALGEDIERMSLHAGLLLVGDGERFLYLARRLQHPDGKTPQLSALFGLWANNQLAGTTQSTGKPYSAPSVVFRISRTGETFLCEVSEDGKSNWVTMAKPTAEFPAKISVGVFAGHDGDCAIETVFEDFTVTTEPTRR